VDRATVDVYERAAREWAARRGPGPTDRLDAFARSVLPGAPSLDLGAGPGWHTARLPGPAIAADAAVEMLRLVPGHAPRAWRVAADLEALPFRTGALGGCWSQKTLHHVPAERLPLALWDVHRCLRVGAPLGVSVLGPVDEDPDAAEAAVQDPGAMEFPGRHFSTWRVGAMVDVVVGAGFQVTDAALDGEWVRVRATRARTLADTVGPAMSLLLVGLNPSEHAADHGVGFARPGNRFWPAALASGIVTRDRDPRHALVAHGVGMTDLAKRATPRADAIAPAEFREGAQRVARLVSWLRPRAVCFVGLTGYRAAVRPGAAVGWQAEPFAGRPAYVMANPSGANAHVGVDDLARHLRAAATGPAGTRDASPPAAGSR
jgi:TDG/mug DNA glycosylase family protein